MQLLIRKTTKSQLPLFLLVVISFAASCINSYLLVSWLVLLPFVCVLLRGRVGAVFALLQITFRTIINPGIACSFSGYAGTLKWIAIFSLSLYLLLLKKTYSLSKRIASTIAYTAVFAVVSIIAAWFVSSFPVGATMKVVSWFVPYVSILVGVYCTADINWIKVINQHLGLLCFGSIPFMFTSVGYLRNGVGFQGLFNHPNMFGIVLTLFVAGYLYKKTVSIKTLCVVASTVMLSYLTGSRTGLFSQLLIIVTFFIFSDMPRSKKWVVTLFTFFVAIITVIFDARFLGFLSDFTYKGGSAILYSRENQIAGCINRFVQSPMFGTGFNVPFISGDRSYSISFDGR